MKQRFKKLLAAALAAALCIPALPAKTVNAADAEGVFWVDAETIPVSTISETGRSVNFNGGWKFNLGDSSTAYQKDFNDSDWEGIRLPHDFSIFQDFTANGEAESGFLPGGTGWYRKSFTIPQSLDGKSIVLNFDGAYKDTYVYVNGELIGENHYGYTPFAFDITEKLICNGTTENLIAVKVDHQIPSSRWYSGSGIYRDVTLVITDPIHIANNGTYITTPKLAESNGSDGTVHIAVDVQNDSTSPADITVRNTIFKKGSETPSGTIDKTETIPAGGTKNVTSEVSVSSPKLWSIEKPELYYVQTEILKGSAVVDRYDMEFGFKWYEFADNTGFKLNGNNVKINGVCMHHDQGALGSAAYYDAIYRQMSIMKDMGVNTIRITHNPGAEILVDICNELGLLVIEEFFDGWAWKKNGNTYDFSAYFNEHIADGNQVIGGSASMTWAEFTLKSIVKRDRNDASIILWSLGNEISESSGSDISDDEDWKSIAVNLIDWTEDVDTAHPVTSGSNRRSLSAPNATNVTSVNQTVYERGGVPGYNYGDLDSMNTLHTRYPVMLWSETVSPGNSRGIYTTQSSQANADGKYHLTSYDTSCVGWGKTVHDSMYPTLTNDYIAGECVWTGFDYIGEPTPWNGTGRGDGGRGAIPNSSYFGIVETSGFPKDNFYLYRSQWNQTENTLHLVTAWDPDNMMETAGKTPVWIYSNAAKVELYRNDTKVGTATRKALSGTTTAAGHIHYEYETASNDPDLCTTTSGSGSTSLYSVFYVAFEPGTISAKAFDENGNEITDSCTGNTSVTTPDAASKLSAYTERGKESITADGSSLSYITVDITDAKGNLDTTASNEIQFTLTGNGEIMGVDNGDQATVNKYQQTSVLKSKTSANIDAFSGKALVIVRSTNQAGSFTLKAESSGLESSSVTVTTKAASTGSAQLAYYNLSRHCYVPTGSADIALPDTIKAGLTDGSSTDIPVTWNDYDKTKLTQRGTIPISGSFTYSGQTFGLSVTAHVYDPIGGAQGFSLYTEPNVIPALPASAMAYFTDGDSFEEFPVTWDTSKLTAASLAESGNVVSVPGTVTVLNKTFQTAVTIRVAKGENPVPSNVAKVRDHLVENERYGDVLTSLTNGVRASTESSERWTTWSRDLPTEPRDDIAIAMDWATATMTDQINLFFYKEDTDTSVLPTHVKFEYALSSNYDKSSNWLVANEWFEIGYSEPADVDGFTNTANTIGKSYQLNQAINPQAIRITFSQPANSFIGLNEVEVIGTAYSYYPKTSAELSIMDGTKEITPENNKEYEIKAGFADKIVFKNPNNAALTFIYQDDPAIVKVNARSEDGSSTLSFTVKLTDIPTEESKSNLRSKLDEYKKLDSKFYTAESYNALKSLIAQIESQIDQLSESELKAKLNELNTRKSNLKPAGKTDPGNTLKAGDKTKIGDVEYQVLDPVKKTAAAAKLTKTNAAKITVKDTVTINKVSCTVVQISDKAFQGAKKLKTVTIGTHVTKIGKNAFQNCKALKTVTFKNTSVTFGKAVFKKAKSGITVKGTKKLKGKKLNNFKKKLTKAGMKKPKLR